MNFLSFTLKPKMNIHLEDDRIEVPSHPIQKQIGSYSIGKEIGSGAFGKVVKGTHILTNETVAIKILDKIMLSETPEDLELLEQEIDILKIVRHKNIVQLYEILETPQHLYIVMEYCDGKDLMDYILTKTKLSEMESLKFFKQLINALLYLHGQNITHRDIKIDNMLLDNKKNLKLVDFGLSTKYSDDKLLQQPCGTVVYAPEVLDGREYHGMLADVWSSGIVLYGMLSGYLPFCDQDDEVNKQNVLKGDIEIPSEFSPMVKDLLFHMLDMNPMTRYTLNDIQKHPWFNLTSVSMVPGIVIGFNKIPVDERILKIIESFGLDKDKVKVDLVCNKYNAGTAMYYLIVRKLKNQGITSISDMCSDEFIDFIYDEKNVVFKRQISDAIISRNDDQFKQNNNNNNECKNTKKENSINKSKNTLNSSNKNSRAIIYSNNKSHKEIKNRNLKKNNNNNYNNDTKKSTINYSINNNNYTISDKIPKLNFSKLGENSVINTKRNSNEKNYKYHHQKNNSQFSYTNRNINSSISKTNKNNKINTSLNGNIKSSVYLNVLNDEKKYKKIIGNNFGKIKGKKNKVKNNNNNNTDKKDNNKIVKENDKINNNKYKQKENEKKKVNKINLLQPCFAKKTIKSSSTKEIRCSNEKNNYNFTERYINQKREISKEHENISNSNNNTCAYKASKLVIVKPLNNKKNKEKEKEKFIKSKLLNSYKHEKSSRQSSRQHNSSLKSIQNIFGINSMTNILTNDHKFNNKCKNLNNSTNKSHFKLEKKKLCNNLNLFPNNHYHNNSQNSHNNNSHLNIHSMKNHKNNIVINNNINNDKKKNTSLSTQKNKKKSSSQSNIFINNEHSSKQATKRYTVEDIKSITNRLYTTYNVSAFFTKNYNNNNTSRSNYHIYNKNDSLAEDEFAKYCIQMNNKNNKNVNVKHLDSSVINFRKQSPTLIRDLSYSPNRADLNEKSRLQRIPWKYKKRGIDLKQSNKAIYNNYQKKINFNYYNSKKRLQYQKKLRYIYQKNFKNSHYNKSNNYSMIIKNQKNFKLNDYPANNMSCFSLRTDNEKSEILKDNSKNNSNSLYHNNNNLYSKKNNHFSLSSKKNKNKRSMSPLLNKVMGKRQDEISYFKEKHQLELTISSFTNTFYNCTLSNLITNPNNLEVYEGPIDIMCIITDYTSIDNCIKVCCKKFTKNNVFFTRVKPTKFKCCKNGISFDIEIMKINPFLNCEDVFYYKVQCKQEQRSDYRKITKFLIA